MTSSIFTIVVFIAITYIYSKIITQKKRKKEQNKKENPSEYHSPYQSPYQWYYYSKRETGGFNPPKYNNYVTKYNSQEDYREVIPKYRDPKDFL